jgi:uncharacterized protein YndB with AHSA1/START domain
MTNPEIPHRLEFELEVPGTPEDVWQAIATATGISSWMMETELEERVGGSVIFHMGPDSSSKGHVTAFEPARRIEYEEDWATLVGRPDAPVTPLVTEFLVEARSGGTCVVRVVTSAFGTGADWENEFFQEMESGWGPMLDNLRIYLAHFPGQAATTLSAGTGYAGTPEDAISTARQRLCGDAAVGDAVSERGIDGRLERSEARNFLVRVERPVSGLLAFYAYDNESGSNLYMAGYLYSDAASDYVSREQEAWQSWLEATAATAVDAST